MTASPCASVHPSQAPADSAGRTALVPPAPREVSPNAVTHKEMAAVRPRGPLPSFDSFREGEEERVTRVSMPPLARPQAERTVLIRLDGVDAGSLVTLGAEGCTVGRHVSNTLRVAEGGVSRFHARITWLGNAYAIEDLGSANGTWLKAQRVTRAVLSDGDVLQFGSHASFRFTVTDGLHEGMLRKLHESSTRDPLTGAYNRRHFDERLREELAYALRHRADLGVVMLDIDHFKQVNDTRGHQAGDAVIRHVAQVTAAQLRSEDVFARYGGEEFVVLLRATDVRGAVRVAERIRASVEALSARFEKSLIPVTVSGGAAALSDGGDRSGSALLGRADERLYGAKRAGRNRIVGALPGVG